MEDDAETESRSTLSITSSTLQFIELDINNLQLALRIKYYYFCLFAYFMSSKSLALTLAMVACC